MAGLLAISWMYSRERPNLNTAGIKRGEEKKKKREEKSSRDQSRERGEGERERERERDGEKTLDKEEENRVESSA